jgi:hypothetical protein
MATEPLTLAPHGVLHGLLADLARLALVDVADAAHETALQVAEGVAAHALDVQLGLDLLAQQVGQGPGAAQLHIAVRVPFQVLGQLDEHRRAGGVVDALADRHHAAPVALHRRLDVEQEALDVEDALGQVDQVRPVVGELLAQRRGGGQEAGVPPHHHADVDAGQTRVVEVGAGKGLGDETRRAREARRVVVQHQVVVDGLGDVDAAQRVVRAGGLLGDDADGVAAVVAADVEEMLDAMRPQHLEHLLAVGEVGLVAGAAQCRRRRAGHQLEVVAGLLREVDEVLVDDAAHAVARAVDALDADVAPRLQHHAHQALVDDRGGAAALRDEDLAGAHADSFRNRFARPASRAGRRAGPRRLRRRWPHGAPGARRR